MTTERKQSEFLSKKFDINDLTKQICLEDLKLFKAISIEEINSFNWTKASKKNLCPNIMISNKQFNKINLWAQKEIINFKNSPLGITMLSKMINLSKCLLDHKNFQSSYSVKSALHSTSVFRLDCLWSEISKKDRLVWDKLVSIFNVEENYNKLRKAMKDTRKPCIPYIGVYLSDLTGLDAAYPLVDGVESESRKSEMEKIYKSIRHFQSSSYDFKWNLGMEKYLQSMEYMEEFQNYIIDNLFNSAKALESDSNAIKTFSPTPSYLNMQTALVRGNTFQPSHRKCYSLDPKENGIYRQISDLERGSPSSKNFDSLYQIDSETNEPKSKEIYYLLDDSIAVPENSTSNNSNLIERFIVHNGSMHGVNPINNLSSEPKIDPESDNTVQYCDKDTSSVSTNAELIAEGHLKREVKPKPSSSYKHTNQKVFMQLYRTSFDCYISFLIPKISKPKSIEDYQQENNSRILIPKNSLQMKGSNFNSKIYVNLPHEIFILRATDSANDKNPTINQWWAYFNEPFANEKSSKSTISDLQPDLINLNDDFTRL